MVLVNILVDENGENKDFLASTLVETMAPFLFVLFNSADNVAFAKEGNTAKHEIRLYNTPEDAKKSAKDYEVITARELKQMDFSKVNKS